jgi:capsular exopolysaccharide synthesis family protein
VESEFLKLPSKEAQLSRLKRIYDINEKFYSQLLEKKAEFSITKAGIVSNNIILEYAVPQLAPISPNRKIIIAASALVAFLIGFIIVFVKYLFYNEITSLDEINQYTDAALLGIIPKYKKEIPVSQLLIDKNPKSAISESFRSVRTNLQFISNEPGSKVVAITSTISGEGKTFVAINLAGVLAFSDKKVIIIDLDMRKPKIHLGFNFENLRGMSTILIGKDAFENCINKSSLKNLDFITAGPIPPNPSELILSPLMYQLIEQLKQQYDMIIIDTPPVGIVTDGVEIISKADYPIYIVAALIRSGCSSRISIN